MTVFLEECPQSSVLEIAGTLRAPVDTKFRQNLETLLASGERRILVNLGRVLDIDAAGIGELMRAYHTTRVVGGVLSIAHANDRIRELLEIAGVLGLLSETQSRPSR